jgi:hypothetical protein
VARFYASGTIMASLQRRIAALETAKGAQDDISLKIAEKAMGSLWADDAEQLIRASGAERVGRPLTEREAKAKQTYVEAVEREYRWAGSYPTACHYTSIRHIPIRQAAISVVASHVNTEQLELCSRGIRAVQRGGSPSDAESAAMEVYRSEMERISQLAGFGSVQELEAVMWQVYVSESADRCSEESLRRGQRR